MDPQETFNELLECIVDYNNALTNNLKVSTRYDVITHLQDLAEWLDKGGIMPNLNKFGNFYNPGDNTVGDPYSMEEIEAMPVCVICCKPIQPMESECNGCHTHCYDEMIKEAAPEKVHVHEGDGYCIDCKAPIAKQFDFCWPCTMKREDSERSL